MYGPMAETKRNGRRIQGRRAVKELAQGEVPPLFLKKGTFLRFRDPNHYLN